MHIICYSTVEIICENNQLIIIVILLFEKCGSKNILLS